MDEYVFKRVNQAVILNCVKVDGDVIQIDTLLFQRLSLVVLKMLLCSYPQALFRGMQFLREAKKPVLAKAIWSLLPDQVLQLPIDPQYVLDGGAFLQCIPWRKGATFQETQTSDD